MLPLRHVHLWRRLSAALLLLVLAAALAPGWWFDDKVEALSWFEHADKWMHGATFLALSLWFTGLLARRNWWWLAVGLLCFGLFIEGCQLLVGYRMADWFDMAANTAGILLGLAIAAAGLGGWGPRIEDWYARRNPI